MSDRRIAFACLGIPRATEKLAVYFALNGTARPTVRELQRTLSISSASVQRDLDRLVQVGALETQSDGRLVRYAPRAASPIWKVIRLLVAEGPSVTDVGPGRVREAAAQYGVDIGQLKSMLRLTPEERLMQLDANAAFLAEARENHRASSVRRRT